MTIEANSTEGAESTTVEYGDMRVLDVSGARNSVYLIPADEHGGVPCVFVWSSVGSGWPMHGWHRRWRGLGGVSQKASPESIERVLRAHESEILAISDAYLGTEWDGSNLVGKWAGDNDSLEYGPVQRISDALQDVATYWDASDWYAGIGGTDAVLREIATADSLDEVVEAEVEAGARNEALLDPTNVSKALLWYARDWLEHHDWEDDRDEERVLRLRLLGWIAQDDGADVIRSDKAQAVAALVGCLASL